MPNASRNHILQLPCFSSLSVASLADIEEIRDELMEQGYVRDRNKKQRKKKKKDKPALACYKSSEGFRSM